MTDHALTAEQPVATLTVEVEGGAPVVLTVTEQTALLTTVAEQGPAGVGQSRIVTQDAPSASWVIPHTLGRPPAVGVYLAGGELVLADVVASADTVSVTLAAPASGFVVLS